MTDKEKAEEQIFKKRFPEYCADAICLSPYFDLFQIGFEEGEKQNEVKLDKAKEIIARLVEGIRIISDPKVCMADVDAFVSEAEQFLKEVSE